MHKITSILFEAENILDSEISPTSNTDLTRIANALERIAATLEKLTGNKADTQSLIQPVQENTSKPIARVIPQKTPNLEKGSEQPGKPVKVQQPDLEVIAKITPIIEKVKSKENDQCLPTQEDKISLSKPVPKYGLLEGYLNQHGIFIQKSQEQKLSPEQEKKLDQIAIYLGQNFTECQNLYQILKRKISTPENSFEYSLAGATDNQNKKVQEFCRLLKAEEILEENNYTDKPDYKFHLKLTGKKQKFLSGAWLEKYVKTEVERIIYLLYPQKGHSGYKTLPNSNIKFENGKKTELDLFFTVGGKLFCIEAKTRPSSKDLKDFIHRIEPLQLKAQNLLIVTAEKSSKECEKLTQGLGGFKVVGLDDFEQALISMIKAACDAPQNKIALG